jgi:predicted O-methyltransferase YrrM
VAQIQGARNILEIGTLGGYSTIWLAGALQPGGRLVTLEADSKHAGEAIHAKLVRRFSRNFAPLVSHEQSKSRFPREDAN